MKHLSIWAALLSVTGGLISMQSKANETVEQAINLYFHGTYEANEDMMRKAFHPDANIVGFFNGDYIEWNLEDFINRVTGQDSQQQSGEAFAKRIIDIQQSDHIAVVKAYAPAFGNEFTDFISLIKTDSGWKIRHKQFTNTGE